MAATKKATSTKKRATTKKKTPAKAVYRKTARNWKKKLEKVKFKIGGKSYQYKHDPKNIEADANPELCIMELVAWAQGHKRVTDKPACVSQVITETLIRYNDSRGPSRGGRVDKEIREVAMAVIPKITGTRPVLLKDNEDGTVTALKASNPEYKEAELERRKLLAEFTRFRNGFYAVTPKEMIELITKMAAVGKSKRRKTA